MTKRAGADTTICDQEKFLTAFQGRELPGFTNSQVFYGFMIQNIEEWRPYVEECRQEFVESTQRVADALLNALAPTYPMLVAEVRSRVIGIVEEQGDAVRAKLDDVFTTKEEIAIEVKNMLEKAMQVTCDMRHATCDM